MLTVSTTLRFFLWTLCSITVHGALRFANYYQDHMVLQRAPQQAIVWGYTDTLNVPIRLTMNNKSYYTMSYKSFIELANVSIWSVTLDAQTDEGPFQIQVTQPLANGSMQTITLNDVLFGDVWICSGQSNMQFAVSKMFNATIEIENAGKYSKVRLFTASTAQAYTPQEELLSIGLRWSVASATSVASGYTSAVCWLYGRMIHEGLGGRPMGLIHTSWGGTDIEYWSPPEALKDCGITESNQIISAAKDQKSEEKVNVVLNNTVLYNAMIHPFTRMVIKGAVWYQGENNANFNRDKYPCTFSKMIEYWRAIWHTRTNSITDPLFPFGFVQLSTNDRTGKVVGGFPWIRWHQTFDVGYVPNSVVPNVFMAVALDLRDDEGGIHPRNKLDVGYRLSRSGLAVAYGYKNITYQGPTVASISVASDSRKINITYAGQMSSSVELRNPNGFEICCTSKPVCLSSESVWATATASQIQGSSLAISLAVPSSCILKPIIGLRYLWRETPCLFKQAAVYSSTDSDLPAPPYIHFF
ncbi:unnamed protein product [Rotaria socialis]|uniref:Sialate O-acetylesterase domain-containing protein n=2 Tax=Rotaria socialis TaxID=392032 RepID=A0A820F5L4_9BILA|nr:unnamed protein product [Rotaria socialis]CAF4258883.1 unnamed protein product [Rotaria socialis]CAF4532123.1 unnamed protein product [Rotaria socialis]